MQMCRLCLLPQQLCSLSSFTLHSLSPTPAQQHLQSRSVLAPTVMMTLHLAQALTVSMKPTAVAAKLQTMTEMTKKDSCHGHPQAHPCGGYCRHCRTKGCWQRGSLRSRHCKLFRMRAMRDARQRRLGESCCGSTMTNWSSREP